MVKIRFVFAGLLLAVVTSSTLRADERAAQDEEFGEARALLQMGREDIIRDEIRFSEEEAAAFWPAYEAYREDVMLIRNRQADLVIAYLSAHRNGAVSEEQAEELIDEGLAIKSDVLNVQKKHLQRFREVLPAWKAARFYQLENKLDAELDVQLARFVPLMDPT